MDELVKHLLASGVFKTPRIIEAFRAIDRADFVLPDYKGEAYMDYPLPIGHGQTISQPTTVAFMLELLDPRPGNVILDVGSGSGWTTALLSRVVGKGGKVFGIELLPELARLGEENVKKYNFIEKGIAEIRSGNAEEGIPGESFDRILAGASAEELPRAWKDELKTGGIIVAPIRDSIWKFTKNKNGAFSEEEHPGFAFVPFVTDTSR